MHKRGEEGEVLTPSPEVVSGKVKDAEVNISILSLTDNLDQFIPTF